jgi:hypothetical protein
MADTHQVLTAQDMDGHTKLFGYRVVPREGNVSPLVEIYIEDDENYFFKMAFDAYWVHDLNYAVGLLTMHPLVREGHRAVVEQIQMAKDAL